MTRSPQAPDMYDRLQLLQQYRHVAIVGISTDPYRPSHFVAIYLQAEGYDIIPINPRYTGQTLLGKRVYASLIEAKAAGKEIEIVDVFRRAEDIPPVALKFSGYNWVSAMTKLPNMRKKLV